MRHSPVEAAMDLATIAFLPAIPPQRLFTLEVEIVPLLLLEYTFGSIISVIAATSVKIADDATDEYAVDITSYVGKILRKPWMLELKLLNRQCPHT